MGNEIINRWIEAGKIIATDPGAKVLCPVCQKVFLQVTDVRNEKNLSELERHMICEECGAYNSLLKPCTIPNRSG
jgi:Fe-S cluster assembly scaffold protein SufB